MPMRGLALLALLGAPAAADGGAAAFQRVRFDNGLTLLVQEDHRLPLVSVGMMYAAGARNEAAGQTGIAHYVEHMAFRATARFPGSASTEAVTRLGGRWSGYTWIDQTYYAATVPRQALGLALDVERERMAAASFDPRDFERERASVVAELRSYDDPHSLLYDAVLAASFELHPYRHNTIGWLTDVEQITREEAHAFYRRYYHPNNAVLAVVGDVDAGAVREEVRRRFAALPPAGAASAVRTVEPAQEGQRRVTLRRPGPHAEVLAAWRAPALTDADFARLVLFDALLAGGKGFRFTEDYAAPPDAPLQRALVGAALATRAGSDWQASRYPYVYTLHAAVAEEAGLEAAEAALLRAVEEAAARTWTEAELAAARRQVRAGWASDLDDLAGRAHQLAFFENAGGAEELAGLLERIQRVDAGQLQRFARAWLRPHQATIGRFVPVAGTPGAARVTPPPVAPPAGAGVPAAARRESPAAPPAVATERAAFTLANGVRARVVAGTGAGLAALEARITLPPAEGPTSSALAALLVERLARRAAGEPAGVALAFALHDEPSTFANARWIAIGARPAADDLSSVLSALALRLREGGRDLPPPDWAALVASAGERARENSEAPETALWSRALAALYPAGSAGAVPAWSSEQALAAVAPQAFHAFAQDVLRPERLTVAVAGVPSSAAARRLLEGTVGALRAEAAPPARARPLPSPRGPAAWTETVIPWPDKAQNDVLVVWPGQRRSPADVAATEALLYLLGETGYAGRLGRALVEPGLVYSVYTTLEEAPATPGFLAIRTAAARKDTRETLRRIREVLETAARGAFTSAELEEAKTYLRGRELLRQDGSASAAAAALEEATDPNPFDAQRLTLAQLNATARRLFARGAPLALVVGPGME